MGKKPEKSMRKFGLIGRDISYSFSRTYFDKKFERDNINNSSYENFDISSINEFPNIIKETENLKGLNVTIPYKETIIPFLNKIEKKAKKIGAVNTIKVTKKGKLTGYNTDYYGFKKSIEPFLKLHHKSALILGTGGASKAIAYALKKLDINYKYVSRSSEDASVLNYSDLSSEVIKSHHIIINCTPLGTFPNIEACPDIPYSELSSNHLLYDLVYNPEETQFMKNGKTQGAVTLNGLKMLTLQAEKAWEIWNS